MGKYKAGDRVKILAGHPYWLGDHDIRGAAGEGVYVSRDTISAVRGKHQVRVIVEGEESELSFKGRELELLPDTADTPAQEQWVPKVGDRVRFKIDSGPTRPKGSEGIVDEGFSDTISRVLFDAPFDGWGDTGLNWHVHHSDLEPLPVAEQPAAEVGFTIEAGKLYQTRDGQKKGPITRPGYYEEWPFEFEGKTYRPNGTQAYRAGDISEDDLVAEWVEPAYTLGKGKLFIGGEPVADITSLELPATTEAEPKFKAGDKVRALKSTFSGDYKAGEIYEVREALAGHVKTVRDSFGSTSNGWGDHNFEAVPAEPATTEAKFKVGDRVRYTGTMYERPCLGTVAKVEEGRVSCNDWTAGSSTGRIDASNLELVPTPVGADSSDTTPPTNFIVARLTTNGSPRPNTRPRVHTSLEAAEAEAQRLADRLGDEFAVYQRVSVREVDAGPVPEGWQRGDFNVAFAHEWLERGTVFLNHPFDWRSSKQGYQFWLGQHSTLTPLGRAILRKWIAEVEAGQGADKATAAEVAA